MQIPLIDLKAQYNSIKSDIDAAISQVVGATAFIGGKYVGEFEKSFASFCASKYCVGVASGTDALYLGLRALGLKAGDEVITTPFTFIASAEVIERAGAKIVFADIDEKTYNIAPSEIAKKITRKTRVLMPVHIFGQTADMTSINSLARKNRLTVFEDACQAHGAYWNGKIVGTLGKCAGFSFYPSKNLSAYGDGGALTTDDAKLYKSVNLLHDHGRKDKYLHIVKGVNSRLDGIQAAILSAKLQHLNGWNQRRREIADFYTKNLSDVPDIVTPFVRKEATPIFHAYTIRVPKRDKVAEKLKENGVGFAIYYPIPAHLQPALKHLKIKRGAYPVSEAACKSVISLPIYPELTQNQVEYVCDTLKNIIRQL